MEVVAGDFTGAGVGAERGGGEEVLPAPLAPGVRPFGLRAVRSFTAAEEFLPVVII